MANDYDDTRNAILERIKELAPEVGPQDLVFLAEAFAWATAPAQAHGGDGSGPKS